MHLIQKIYAQMEKIDSHICSKERIDDARYAEMERRMRKLYKRYTRVKHESKKVQKAYDHFSSVPRGEDLVTGRTSHVTSALQKDIADVDFDIEMKQQVVMQTVVPTIKKDHSHNNLKSILTHTDQCLMTDIGERTLDAAQVRSEVSDIKSKTSKRVGNGPAKSFGAQYPSQASRVSVNNTSKKSVASSSKNSRAQLGPYNDNLNIRDEVDQQQLSFGSTIVTPQQELYHEKAASQKDRSAKKSLAAAYTEPRRELPS